jgi:hypothetical protein
MEDNTPAPSDAEITTTESPTIQGGYTATIDRARTTQEFLGALNSNRVRLQELKTDYAAAAKADGDVKSKPSGKRRMIFHEIKRVHGTMEGIKNELTQRGEKFDIHPNDHEHPNAAVARLAAEAAKKAASSNDDMSWFFMAAVIIFVLVSLWFFM